MANNDIRVFCGRSNIPLAHAVGRELEQFTHYSRPDRTGDPVACVAKAFNDGEPNVELADNVRRRDAFIIQSTQQPGTNFIELCAILDAAKRAEARDRTAVIPYFGFGRQDRRVKPRTPVTAALAMRLLRCAGATGIVTVDLHAAQIEGAFDGPVSNIEALPVLMRAVAKDLGLNRTAKFSELAFVSPDDNGVERCREVGKYVNCGRVTFFMKGRDRDGNLITDGVIRDPALVRGRSALIIDDMIDTAGTMVLATNAAKGAGATRIIGVGVHPIFSTNQKTGISAAQLIAESPMDVLYVADTVPIDPRLYEQFPRFREKVRVVSTAWLLAGAISEIHESGSVSRLFDRTCEDIFPA